jgi:hypothetical protein
MPSTYGLPRNEGSSSDESSSEDANSEELSSDEQDNHTIDGESSDNDDPSIISPNGLVLTDGARPGECGRVMSNNESTSSDRDLSRVGDTVKNIFHEFISTDVKQKARALFPEILPEELAFAQWAFGSDGLTALQVLAFGDFSFRGRFPDQHVLLSRMEQTTSGRANDRLSQSTDVSQLAFRRVTNDDTCLQALVDAQCDLLEACPVDSLLRPL